MWVLKAKGESYYVDHVECEIPWSTKETPNNSHTKGSIKVKQCHLVIDDDNTAYLKPLTPKIKARLHNPKKIIRVITKYGAKLKEACKGLKHHKIKHIGGVCSTRFFITEFNSDEDFSIFKLSFDGDDLRVLKENESYYKMYGNYMHDDYDDLDDGADADFWEDAYEN